MAQPMVQPIVQPMAMPMVYAPIYYPQMMSGAPQPQQMPSQAINSSVYSLDNIDIESVDKKSFYEEKAASQMN